MNLFTNNTCFKGSELIKTHFDHVIHYSMLGLVEWMRWVSHSPESVENGAGSMFTWAWVFLTAGFRSSGRDMSSFL